MKNKKKRKITKMLKTWNSSTKLLNLSMRMLFLNVLNTIWDLLRPWTSMEIWKALKRKMRKRKRFPKRRRNDWTEHIILLIYDYYYLLHVTYHTNIDAF